jgi:hypothetical protein
MNSGASGSLLRRCCFFPATVALAAIMRQESKIRRIRSWPPLKRGNNLKIHSVDLTFYARSIFTVFAVWADQIKYIYLVKSLMIRVIIGTAPPDNPLNRGPEACAWYLKNACVAWTTRYSRRCAKNLRVWNLPENMLEIILNYT